MRKVNKSYLDYLALRNVPVSVSDAIAFVTFVRLESVTGTQTVDKRVIKLLFAMQILAAFIDMQILW